MPVSQYRKGRFPLDIRDILHILLKKKAWLLATLLLSLVLAAGLVGCSATADSHQSGDESSGKQVNSAALGDTDQPGSSEAAASEPTAAGPDTDASGLHYGAFLDNETGEVIQIGDTRARLDKLFGKAEEEPVEEVTYFQYLGGSLRAAFDEEDRLFAVEVQDADRFACMNYHSGMAEDEVAKNFDMVYEFEKYRDYAAFFDANGKRATANDFIYVVKLIYEDGKCNSFTLYNVQ